MGEVDLVAVFWLGLFAAAGAVIGLGGKALIFSARPEVPRWLTTALGGGGSLAGFLVFGGLDTRSVASTVAAIGASVFLVVVAAGATGT